MKKKNYNLKSEFCKYSVHWHSLRQEKAPDHLNTLFCHLNCLSQTYERKMEEI